MTERDPANWRDEKRLPLAELDQALASYSQDGQLDDATGGDAGAEAEFGDGAIPADRNPDEQAPVRGDPDPDSEAGRRLRPSPDGTSPVGRSGPH